MKLKLLKHKGFIANIVHTVQYGKMMYRIEYRNFNHYKLIWDGDVIFEHKCKHPVFDGIFMFYSIEEAETYINNIEQPEDIIDEDDLVYTELDDCGINVYPKGFSLIKKYGCFRVHTKDNGLDAISNHTWFHFNDTNKSGNYYKFDDKDFFHKPEEFIQMLIKNRYITFDDSVVKKMTVTTVSAESLDKIKKISDETKALHEEMQTFYESQEKMMNFVNNLNKRK